MDESRGFRATSGELMPKANWQDPQTSEIRSTQIAGLQEAVGKFEDALDMQTTAVANQALVEVYIKTDDRYRIYQIADKRNWLASPAPVIKVNGGVVASGFTIDYGGGAVIFNPRLTGSDTVTADFTYTNATSGKFHATTGHAHSGAAGDAPNVPWNNVSGKPTTFAPAAHAASHGTGQADAVTPAAIGAVQNAGLTPSIMAGPDANKPTPNASGRIYIATDTNRIFRDNGAWGLIEGALDAHTALTAAHSATAAATVDRIILRDAAGRAKVVAPSAEDDIALKSNVTTVQTNLTTHTGTETAGVHGSASAATVNKLIHRDAAGRAQVAAPSVAADIARKDTVDAVQTNLTTHEGNTTTAHGAVSAATASKLVVRDASGRAAFAAPSAAGDAAILSTVTTHAALTAAGTHGSASAATVNTLIHRDASGRAKVVAPSAADDIARKDTVDAVQTNLNNHAGDTAHKYARSFLLIGG